MKVKESLNVTFDEIPPKTSLLEDDDLVEEDAIKVSEKKPSGNDVEYEVLENGKIISIKESKSHPLENVIGNLNQRTLRSQSQDKSNFFCFLSTVEPKNVDEALKDEGTKWVFQNKLEKNGVVSRNKARLVAQGFIDFAKPDHVYRLKTALYGLKQASKACFEDSKQMKMPMSLDTKLTKDEEGEFMDNTKYRVMIVMERCPHLDNGIYDIVDRVMRPLALVQERRPRKDHAIKKGCHSTSSSSAFQHGSSTHQFDDDEAI
ncbi:hypothetical protein Tco_1483867 [Tanacetum coccineum]